ncbi:transcription intermediary factor 1-alpha-like [Saccostrea cucullata]|uniref:transcription intermediary factor 1-alpha-like n=1 Tax=Saccostrea cuccullata TaxID=36930 RepID=UPI002ED02F4C
MATSCGEIPDEDLTMCSICVEKFKTPRCLPCMHSFCHKCLTSYIESSCLSMAPRLGFNCPLCREYVPNNGAFDNPEEWAKNFPLNDVLESLLVKSKEQLCAACLRDNETESATGFCLSCLEYLCTMCTKYHRKHLLSRDHTVCQKDDIQLTKMHIFGKYFRCTEHSKKISLFCNDHEQPCCLICTGTCGTKHRECKSIDSIEEAALKVKNSGKLESLIKEVKIIERKLKDAMQEQSKKITELEDAVDEMTNQTEKEFKELVDHIETLKNQHLDELAVAQKKGRQEMEQCTRALSEGMDCVNYCVQNVERARDTENEIEILVNYCMAKETALQLKSKKNVLLNLSGVVLPHTPELSIQEKQVFIFTGTFLANNTFATPDHSVNVTAISGEGDIAWKYEHHNMKGPCDLDKDNVGNIVVAARESNNIHILSSAGAEGEGVSDGPAWLWLPADGRIMVFRR